MSQVLNIKDNEVKSIEVLRAQTEVLWTCPNETVSSMVQSGWLVMTINVNVEGSTYEDLLEHLTKGEIYFR